MGSEVTIEFKAWPKIARLNRDIIITEKIDGTNAAVGVLEDGTVYAQSRTRVITPEQDNYGFARWVSQNEDALREVLGAGLHFGEWWGSGVNRGYGLEKGEKRFSLFNTPRYEKYNLSSIPGVSTVPVLYEGAFSTSIVQHIIRGLEDSGSIASPGFWDPEGVVVFHTAAQTAFKVTLTGDEKPKGKAA